MGIKDMKRIVPTVWIRNSEEFYSLAYLFFEFGIRKLRINCTRRSVQAYIHDITVFNKWCRNNLGMTFHLILDLPIPNRKARIYYCCTEQEKIVKKDEILYVSRYQRTECELYTDDFDYFQKLNFSTHIYIGEMGPEFIVMEKSKDRILLKCIKEGELGHGKYIYTDALKYQPCSEEEILQYVELCSVICPDEVAFSFVNNKEDIIKMSEIMSSKCVARYVAKIETKEGCNNLHDIIKYCDAIVIARGDLLNNVGYNKFSKYSMEIVNICELNNVDYYVATGVLDALKTDKKIGIRAALLDIYTILSREHAQLILDYGICDNISTAEKSLKLIRDMEL